MAEQDLVAEPFLGAGEQEGVSELPLGSDYAYDARVAPTEGGFELSFEPFKIITVRLVVETRRCP